VVVCVDFEGGERGGALALARALSTRSWLRSEMPGWLQLVPGVEVTADTPIRTLLLVPALSPTTRSAVEALPAGWIEPLVYRAFSHRGDDFLLLEDASPAASEPIEPRLGRDLPQTSDAGPTPSTAAPEAAQPSPPLPTLRSGISESDFRRSSQARRGSGPVQRSPRPRFDPGEGEAAPRERER